MEEQELKQKINEFLVQGEGFKNADVNELKLSPITYNAVARRGIKCLEDANGLPVRNLKMVRGAGENSVREFLDKAEEYGYFVENGIIVRKFDLENQQAPKDEEKISIDDTELSDKLKKKLKKYSWIHYISDIVKLPRSFWGKRDFKKTYIEELENEIEKYGYTFNKKTGYYVKVQPNIIFEQLKEKGIKALNLIDTTYFKKDSYSMVKINRAFEAYLNFVAEEKAKEIKDLKQIGKLEQIEKEVDKLREDYKAYVDEQKELMENGGQKQQISNVEQKQQNENDEQKQQIGDEEQRRQEEKAKIIKGFLSKTARVNREEIRRCHHKPFDSNENHKKTHSYNPFLDEREL